MDNLRPLHVDGELMPCSCRYRLGEERTSPVAFSASGQGKRHLPPAGLNRLNDPPCKIKEEHTHLRSMILYNSAFTGCYCTCEVRHGSSSHLN